MYESPLFWPAYIKGKTLFVLDETLVPAQMKYIPVKDVKGAVGVIRGMKARAFGQFLVVLNTFLLEVNTRGNIVEHLEGVTHQLNHSRPTFPFAEVTGIIMGAAYKARSSGANVKDVVIKTVEGFLAGIRQRRLERVSQLAMAIKDGDSILTHCNVSGELSMAASLAMAKNKSIQFFATETRPYMQGARLTVWELQQVKAKVMLVADNAVGSLMSDRLVNKVIIGSDRSAANGDIANKVGSYQIAMLAKEFGIPLIALTQPSRGVAKGSDMPIEERSGLEVTQYERKHLFPVGATGYYPGFDVVPHQLITKAISIHAGL